jgi:hypothetical protein
MGSIFKTLTSNDRSITPFVAHKTISAISGSNNDILLFKGKFDNTHYNIGDNLDPHVISLLTTVNNEYQYLVHDSIRHLFYNQYDNETKILTENIDKKNVYDYVSCFSIPRNTFGEKIYKDNVAITLNVSGSTKQLVDDGDYNLVDQTVSASIYNLVASGSVIKLDFSDGYIFGAGNITGSYLRDRSNNFNHAELHNVTFESSGFDKEIYFSSTESYARIFSNEMFNFYGDENYNISLLLKIPNTSIYNTSISDEIILTKNGRKTTGQSLFGAFRAADVNNLNSVLTSHYPFTVAVMKTIGDYGKIKFNKYDGKNFTTVTSSLALNDGIEHFIDCQKSGSYLQLYVDGILDAESIDISTGQTENNCDLFIGMRGDNTRFFNGYIKSLDIKENAINADNILYRAQQSLSQSYDYYVGNVFYEQGFINITSNQQYYKNFNTYVDSGSSEYYVSWSLSGYGTNTIYEHEYLCTVSPGDANYSLNPTLFKSDRKHPNEFMGFVSHSMFNTYVTSIGLFDDDKNLLVVGKLSRPIPRLKKIDQTFIIRFDV